MKPRQVPVIALVLLALVAAASVLPPQPSPLLAQARGGPPPAGQPAGRPPRTDDLSSLRRRAGQFACQLVGPPSSVRVPRVSPVSGFFQTEPIGSITKPAYRPACW